MGIVYFSHSYRDEDSQVVSYFGTILEDCSVIPSLDPPSGAVNAAKLERHMLSTDGMIAVLTDREGGVSKHILYEISMCLRARKPLLVFIEDTVSDAEIPSRVLQQRFSRSSFLRQRRSHEHAVQQLKRYIGDRPPPQYSVSSDRRACGLVGLSALKPPVRRAVLAMIVKDLKYDPIELDRVEVTALRERRYPEPLLPVSLGISFIDAKGPAARYVSGLIDGLFVPTIHITGNEAYPFAHRIPREYQPQVVDTKREDEVVDHISRAVALAEQDFLELKDQAAVEKYASMLRTKPERDGGYGSQVRDIIIREVVMRDKYQTGPVIGPVGPNARVGDISGTQSWIELKDNVDLVALATQLTTLKTTLQSTARTDEELVEAEMVSLAEQSARAGNGAKAFGFLKKASQWTLTIASKAGLSVAAAVIASALRDP